MNTRAAVMYKNLGKNEYGFLKVGSLNQIGFANITLCFVDIIRKEMTTALI